MLLVPLIASAGVIVKIPTKSARHVNDERMEIFSIATPTSTYVRELGPASDDPIETKTNRYVESQIVRVVCLGTSGCHIKFGDGDISAATDSDYYIPPNVPEFFAVDDANKYVRVIGATGSAQIYFTEVY